MSGSFTTSEERSKTCGGYSNPSTSKMSGDGFRSIDASSYPTLIVSYPTLIVRGFASSTFGNVRESTPSFIAASIFP
jgi:hypothetical protein